MNKIVLKVDDETVYDYQDEAHPAIYAELHVAGLVFHDFDRVGDSVENGCVLHEVIDEDALRTFREKHQKVADSLGIPLEVESSFKVPEENDDGK